jgi:hypothetical protein
LAGDFAAVFMFPSPTTVDACCPFCRRAVAAHQMTGRGFRCTSDVVIGRDEHAEVRRSRLAQLQRGRALKVHPWAIDITEGSNG